MIAKPCDVDSMKMETKLNTCIYVLSIYIRYQRYPYQLSFKIPRFGAQRSLWRDWKLCEFQDNVIAICCF